MVLEEIFQYYEVKLNNQQKACCPFHQENTPSFTYYPETNSWYCWGSCAEGGDAIDFVKLKEGVEFKEALSKVEEITGLKKEDILTTEEDKEKKESKSKEKIEPLSQDELKELGNKTVYQTLNYRGVRKETDESAKVRSVIENNKVVKRYYPETNGDGKIVGFTCRNEPKDFSYGHIGKVGASNQWDGRFLYKNGGKFVVIVGGQEDRLAAIQMFKDNQRKGGYDTIKVVSPTKGEGNATTQLKHVDNYDFLVSHDNIIIGFDNDEAGIRAARELAALLPKEKVKIASWSRKDPCDMLKEGLGQQFVSDFWSAKDIMQTGIHGSSGEIDDLKEFLVAPKISLPQQLHRVENNMRGGIKSTGCIGLIVAHTSTGKTLLSDLCLYHWILNEQVRPVVVSIERTKEELKLDLLSMHLHKNLTWFKEGQEAVDYLEREDIKPLVENFFVDEMGRDRFYIIDERDGDLDNLKSRMEMANVKYDTDMFIIDPLSDVLRQYPNEVQDDFMMFQKYKKKKGWKMINVLHTRKPAKAENGKTPFVTEYDALGSSTFVQSADWTWVLNRDKMAEDIVERNTTILDMPKCRGGVTGHATDLYYDSETRQQYDKEDYFSNQLEIPMEYDNYPEQQEEGVKEPDF